MGKDKQRFFARVNLLTNMAIAFLAMMLGYWFRFKVLSGVVSYHIAYYMWLGVASAVLHMLLSGMMGMYRSLRGLRMEAILLRIFWVELASMLILLSALFILNLPDVSRLVIFLSFAFGFALSVAKHLGGQVLLRRYRAQGLNQKSIVLIGDGSTASSYRDLLLRRPEYGYRIVGYFSHGRTWPQLDWLGAYDAIEETLNRLSPDEAVIALGPEDYIHITAIISMCEKTGTFLRIIPCYDEYISSRMQVDTIDGINIFDIRAVPLTQLGNAIVKRAMDIVCSAALILVTSPIMLVAAIGTKLSSPGPILFRQERVGKDKRTFQMLKFRSMRVNERERTGWSRDTDSRKTRFGAILRKLSIDELPQFFNVLKGDMSIVGPRPEIPFYVEKFRDEIPLYMIKHYVKPGITGWAQVNGYRGDTSIEGRIEHDLYYIENWTVLFDLKIMFLTVFRMVNREKVGPGEAASKQAR